MINAIAVDLQLGDAGGCARKSTQFEHRLRPGFQSNRVVVLELTAWIFEMSGDPEEWLVSAA
jgi:hypothetical protein